MKGRGPVVHLDRFKKARSIHSILADYAGGAIRGRSVLDIGCGNGGIAEFFAENNEVAGVDVADQRKTVEDCFEFYLVEDETLPFADNEFDVVVSNHVIEHVSDQELHLKEIRRVLKSDGCAYFATPNKSSPIMEGHVGNEMVLKYRDMEPLIRRCGLEAKEYGVDVASRPDDFGGEVQWAKPIPTPVLKLMRPLFPSHIFVLEPG
ncbi:MAG: class I SAM-dependent methyltransferase [Parasphingorhabdus sp.]